MDSIPSFDIPIDAYDDDLLRESGGYVGFVSETKEQKQRNNAESGGYVGFVSETKEQKQRNNAESGGYVGFVSETKEHISKKPLPEVELLPVDDLPLNALPDIFASISSDVSARLSSPADYTALALYVVTGAAIGRRVLFQPKENDTGWRFANNLWGAIVGKPSAMKTPSLVGLLKPLEEIEWAKAAEYNKAVIEYNVDIDLHREDVKAMKDRLKNAKKKGSKDDFDRLREDIINLEQSEPPAPSRSRLIANDTTYEKLADLMAGTDNGLLLFRDELSGWMLRLDKKDAAAERAFYLEVYDKLTPHRIDRIMRGESIIDAPILSMLGGIQPSKIEPLINSVSSGAGDDGLLNRFQLLVYPDTKGYKFVDRKPDIELIDTFSNVIKNINGIPIDDGMVARFSGEAQELFNHWLTDLMSKARDGQYDGITEATKVKSSKALCSIALINQIFSDGECDIVQVDALRKAIDYKAYIDTHIQRLYAIGNADGAAAAKYILSRRNDLDDGFSKRDIERKGWAKARKGQIEQALDLLIDHGYLSAMTCGNSASGRPTARFSWVG